jgi:hypothetical protein
LAANGARRLATRIASAAIPRKSKSVSISLRDLTPDIAGRYRQRLSLQCSDDVQAINIQREYIGDRQIETRKLTIPLLGNGIGLVHCMITSAPSNIGTAALHRNIGFDNKNPGHCRFSTPSNAASAY